VDECKPLIAGIGYGVGGAVKKTFKRQLSEKHVLYTGEATDTPHPALYIHTQSTPNPTYHIRPYN